MESRIDWSSELVKEKILEFHNNGIPLNSGKVQKVNSDLYNAANRLYGSWKNAITQSGINYEEIAMRKKWTKELIIKEILERYDKKLLLNKSAIRIQDNKLYSIATQKRYFGTWENAISAAGLDYNEISMISEWHEDSIKDKIIEMYYNKIPLNGTYIKKNYNDLYCASLRRFGSWKEAIKYSQLDYNKINLYANRTKWTKELIINKIIDRHNAGLLLNSTNVILEDHKLYSAAINKKFFGSWENAVLATGINYNDIVRKIKYRTKEEIINKIIEMHCNGEFINDNYIQNNCLDLYSAAINKKFFGSWENAITNAGLDYDLVRQDSHLMTYYGYKFEKLLEEIFVELDMPFSKGYNNLIRPDFVFQNRWVDAKLSEHTIYSCETIKKYEPFCDKLDIIYLRGDKNRISKITDKTSIYSVYRLIERLTADKRQYYIDLIDNMYKLADEQINKNIIIKGDPKNKKYKGYTWNNDKNRWVASIIIDKHRVYLGNFTDENEAAEAYDKYVIANNLDRKLNFPQDNGNHKNNKYKGCVWKEKYKRWIACITVDYKSIHLGYFANKIDAAKAYDRYVIEHNLNRPINFPE